MSIVAKAHANVALLKYWGKANRFENIPAMPSISLTLGDLTTRTSLSFLEDHSEDQLILNGQRVSGLVVQRVSSHLDLVMQRRPESSRCLVETHNNFPTASGLASSASGFAALTLAAAALGRREYSVQTLSTLARRASASAARSMFGGIVLLQSDQLSESAFATQICPEDAWPDLRVIVGIVSEGPKPLSSTQAMLQTQDTSPYYPTFVSESHSALPLMLDAIKNRDFCRLGELTERSALQMHAAALASMPSIVFWSAPTIQALHLTHELRASGIPVYFTCDAGAHPKLLTLDTHAQLVATHLASIAGIKRTLTATPGKGAHLVEANSS